MGDRRRSRLQISDRRVNVMAGALTPAASVTRRSHTSFNKLRDRASPQGVYESGLLWNHRESSTVGRSYADNS